MDLRTAVATAALLSASVADAGTRLPAPDVAAPVFATRVESTIEIGPDGRVVGYEPVTELKAPLAERVRGLAERLRFEPVRIDGKAVIARTKMRMHLVAEPTQTGDLQVRIEHVGFPDERDATPAGFATTDAGYIRGIVERAPVRYPREALRVGGGLSGRVLVALRLAPDGTVVEAVPRESALYGVKGREKALGSALALFERSATDAIRRWRFDVRVPEGAYPKPEDLTGLIAVEYFVDGHPRPRPGVWLHETRSRERALPWLDPVLAERLPDLGDVGDGGHFGLAPGRFRLLPSHAPTL